MLAKKKDSKQRSMFLGLEDMLNQKHPMYILANKVNWQLFEDSFSSLYCLDKGRPAKPIRLMVGLLILKHLRSRALKNPFCCVFMPQKAHFKPYCYIEVSIPVFFHDDRKLNIAALYNAVK